MIIQTAKSTLKISSTAESTKTSTITTTATAFPTSCPHLDVNDATYHLFFEGSGVTQDTNNLGNGKRLANLEMTSFISQSEGHSCKASLECTQAAYLYPRQYLSFDVYFLGSRDGWECMAYFNWNHDEKYFNVPYPDVKKIFEYTVVY